MNLDQKELIIDLIKANMCNNKLIFGLENAGMQVEDFYGDLETVILKLMGFDLKQREDELYDFYYDTMKELLEIDVKEFLKNWDRLAGNMHDILIRKSVSGQF